MNLIYFHQSQHETSTMTFNCDKMRHIFLTENEVDSDNAKTYQQVWLCEETQELMTSGKAKFYRKIDGSCGALVKNGDSYDIYQRYDDKKRKFKDQELPEGYIKIPSGENSVRREFEKNWVNHHYFLRKLSREPENKTDKRINQGLYQVLAETKTDLTKDFYSVELVGPNFNRTPGMEKNSIAIHEFQKTPVEIPTFQTIPEWFAFFTDYFTNHRDEGLIVEYKNRYWKIHGYKFCPQLPKNYDIPITL